MTIRFHPQPGTILSCDFDKGFKRPEMVKKRPVLAISPKINHRPQLVTVVALSTTRPDPIMDYHVALPRACLPNIAAFQEGDTWVKADMIYAVGFHRLEQIRVGTKDGRREYFTRRLSRERMKAIYEAVLHSLNLGHLAEYL